MATATSEWGMAGIVALRVKVSAIVIVDVLSFSTAVDVAVSRGAVVYPFAYGDPAAARAAADELGAVLAQPRRAAGGQFSLSPASLATIPDGLKLMLPSPNGSRLSLACGNMPVLAGSLRNAAAVAHVARGLAGDGMVGVVPAGELWPDGGLRPGIEDMLGAGAILHHLDLPCSPEARVMRDAYRAAGADIAGLIRESLSGRELIEGGFPEDVELAVAENVSTVAPMLIAGAYRAAESPVATRRTARLRLRPPGLDDLDFMIELFGRPELVAHRPHPVPDTPDASQTRLARDMDHWRQHGFGRWAIEHDGRVIGFGGLTRKPEGLNISYHLHPDAWRHGYASEFVAEALSVAFGLLGAARVIGLVRPANPASRRVLERNGFVCEGEVELDGAPTILLACYPA